MLGGVGVSWYDLDLTCDLEFVNLVRAVSQKLLGVGSWYLVGTLVQVVDAVTLILSSDLSCRILNLLNIVWAIS